MGLYDNTVCSLLTNVEVTYVGVILGLKGVSLEVPAGTNVAPIDRKGVSNIPTFNRIPDRERLGEGEVTRGQILLDGKNLNCVHSRSLFGLAPSRSLKDGRSSAI